MIQKTKKIKMVTALALEEMVEKQPKAGQKIESIPMFKY